MIVQIYMRNGIHADAQASYDENGLPQVNISLDGKGGRMMNRVTKDHVGDQMAVLFVD